MFARAGKLHFLVGYINSELVFFIFLLASFTNVLTNNMTAVLAVSFSSLRHVQLLPPVPPKSTKELAECRSNLLVGAANNHVRKSTAQLAL